MDKQVNSIIILLDHSIETHLFKAFQSGTYNLVFEKERIDDVLQSCQEKPKGLRLYQNKENYLRAQSAQSHSQFIQSDAKPEIYFETSVKVNGVDEEVTESFLEKAKLENPQLSVAIGVVYSFENKLSRSNILESTQKQRELRINRSINESDARAAWLDNCNEMEVSKSKLIFLNRKIQAEKERLSLLEKDFNNGKADINSLMQAEDSLANSELELLQLVVSMENTAWSIRRQQGSLASFINHQKGE